jgi:hypothetical protein
LQVLSSCAKSLQTHAAIVEAVAETVRGDIEESDDNGGETLNKFALLVAQIKDAAAGVEQLRDVNVSRPYFYFSASCMPLRAKSRVVTSISNSLFFSSKI